MMAEVIEGVGKDAEIVTNELGGQQSKSPMAMYLLDPSYLIETSQRGAMRLLIDEDNKVVLPENEVVYHAYNAMNCIGVFMLHKDKYFLTMALDELSGESEPADQLVTISKVLQEGADKYKPNNWRLIPEESHINHALIHLVAFIKGDTQDDHISHAMCRLMMALATERSKDYDYNSYVSDRDNNDNIL